jgi:hypothetical protein
VVDSHELVTHLGGHACRAARGTGWRAGGGVWGRGGRVGRVQGVGGAPGWALGGWGGGCVPLGG